MSEQDVKRELERLAERLARVEKRLGLYEPAEKPPALKPPIPASPIPQQAPAPPRPAPAPVIPPIAPPMVKPAPPPAIAATAAQSVPPVAPPIASPAKAATFSQMQARREMAAVPPRAPVAPRSQGGGKSTTPLELMIGGNWFAWIGAIVVVIAAALAAKLAYDKGLWGKLSPELRCMILAGFALLLIGCGEAALRKVGKAASAGLFSAGLGVAYLTALATFHTFHLVSELGAFVLLCLVAAVGFAVTLRTRFLTIGVLSIVGGYLSPVLLRGIAAFPGALAMYLTMLLAVALALSAFMPRPFRPLRYVALGAQGIVGIWAIEAGPASELLGLVFITLWWAMIQAEAVYAAMRRQSAFGNSIASLLTTAWYVIFGCQLLASAGPAWFDWAGVFAFAVALAAVVIAITFGPGVEGLRELPRTAMDRLAVVLWCSGGVLLATAIALHFDGYGRAIAWLAVALASIEAGRRIRSRGLDVFGMIVGAIALVQVLLLDSWIGRLSSPLLKLGTTDGVVITRWSILALVAIAVVHTAARRLRIDGSAAWRAWSVILAVIGTLMWVGLCANQCHGLSITGGWLLGAAALLAAERYGRTQRYFEIAIVLLDVAAGKWLIVDAMIRRFEPGWDAGASLPVLNWQMGMAVLIAACGWWAASILRRRMRDDAAVKHIAASWTTQILMIGLAVFILIGLSFEIDRLVVRAAADAAAATSGAAAQRMAFGWPVGHVRQLLLTMLWAIGAAAIHALGVMIARRPGGPTAIASSLMARFAWVLLVGCALKWIVGDTLMWAAFAPAARALHLPLINLQMVVGLTLAAVGTIMFFMSGMRRLSSADSDAWADRDGWAALASWLPVAGAMMLLWGLSFEVERAVARWEGSQAADWVALWPAMQLRQLWITLLWAAGGLATAMLGAIRRRREWFTGGWFILSLAAVAWLSIDTLSWRMVEGPVKSAIIFNLQFGVGAAIAAMLAVTLRQLRRITRDSGGKRGFMSSALPLSVALVAAIGLWLGSLEIDRRFAPAVGAIAADTAVARQTALSIYWGLYAIGMIAAGFVKRSPAARYAGLALLAITLAKVFIIDMAGVEGIYRILSAGVLGLLLLATSVGYWKLAPRLMGAQSKDDSDEFNRP